MAAMRFPRGVGLDAELGGSPGPVMMVLPTEPATCLATDAMGKVHASPIENMVEGAPQSSEPHLVTQVWVATKVVGSEGDFVFKGYHGRWSWKWQWRCRP